MLYCRLDRCAYDDEGRTFELRYNVEVGTVNATELRCRDIQMENVSAIKPIDIRRLKRSNAQVQAMAMEDASRDTEPIEYDIVLPISSEAVVLNNCWWTLLFI